MTHIVRYAHIIIRRFQNLTNLSHFLQSVQHKVLGHFRLRQRQPHGEFESIRSQWTQGLERVPPKAGRSPGDCRELSVRMCIFWLLYGA